MSTKQQSLFPPVSTGTYVQPSKHMHPRTITISLPTWSQWRTLQTAEHSRSSISRLLTSFCCFLPPTRYHLPGSHFGGPWKKLLSFFPASQIDSNPAAQLLLSFGFSPLLMTCLLVSIHIAAVILVECASVVLRVWICRPRGAAK